MGEVEITAPESVQNAFPGNPQQGQTCENCGGPGRYDKRGPVMRRPGEVVS